MLWKNSGVASGKGLPASEPMTIRWTSFRLHQIAVSVMRMMLRPGMYTVSSGASYSGTVSPDIVQWDWP